MTVPPVPLAGVIGESVGLSKSPAIFAYWLKQQNLPGHYIPMNVASDKLPDVLKMLPTLGFKGVNVTIPHKEAVLGLAHDISEHAQSIGAANTLTFQQDGRIHADNTDGVGFFENLKSSASAWQAEAGPAVVLGAGGASRAIIATLLDAGVPELRLLNRTRSRAEDLRQHFGSRVLVADWNDVEEILEGANTLVNTTSLGMVGKGALDITLDRLPTSASVTDIVYTPLMTGLLEKAQARGNRTVDGLGMLLHQAVPGFERWFGSRPTVDAALRDEVLK